MNHLTITTATTADIPQLVTLVNSAYRGEHSKKGWTTEAYLIEGTQRVDEASMLQMMTTPGAIIKKCTTADNAIVGCVYLEARGKELYLGMLTVSPEIQATGIGREIVKAAEAYAAAQKFEAIVMVVVSLRRELIDWYIRRGFQLTSERRPFPTDTRFGTPTQPLEFVVLKKTAQITP
ncbi:GNAT family N-acetyltransferase [Deminuibacter soli]|uniref:N-acetyltransferase n=1 Tax=Deminuibacter soli TaxID=2291815 RepID=A0A3E1NKE7_9BACT|nr:GNAT family N-acetyltransferase [Deminuibacter soli]RFM28304.1 N-acetyltransferase [Deminuibacter soli]